MRRIILFLLFFSISTCFAAKDLKGVKYYSLKLRRPEGFQAVHILSIDLKKRNIKATLAGRNVGKRLPLSKICRNNKALAGINGTYFWKDYGPLGLLIIDHEIISAPILRRASFGVADNNSIIWGNPVFKGQVELEREGKSFYFDGINQFPGRDKILLFTQEFGRKTPEYGRCSEIIIINDHIWALGSGGSIIPPGGNVLAAYGNSRSILERPLFLDSVFIMAGLDFHWSLAKYAIGGGPRLLKNGKYIYSAGEESFKKNISLGRAPRTAIGETKEKKLIFVVVDGRQPGYSIGMTLEELATLLKNLGCLNAINLDGGGSSTMYYDGKIMNRPSEGSERAINNAILVN